MTNRVGLWVFVLSLIASGSTLGGEPLEGDAHILDRWHPVGGWNPYGGGIFHWWKPGCFPCATAPDDYCKKPLPRLCWPTYPPSYTFGPTEVRYSPTIGPPKVFIPH
jgi:hypothetical protein